MRDIVVLNLDPSRGIEIMTAVPRRFSTAARACIATALMCILMPAAAGAQEPAATTPARPG
ncbi:MAG TPA: hypothetical protein VJS69_04550, partial [Candidatus Krumholzibacteria bacterium]|nr:hypothetical protein [Candidatus Krumholzibacteria bacterium]